MNVELVPYSKIDFTRYNNCVMSSKFGTMYAMSWYLDAVCKNWDILQAEDYSYVMPLPYVRKYGIKCFLQPPFCQQLGVFSGGAEVDKNVLDAFLRAIPYGIKFLQFNSGNIVDDLRGCSRVNTNYYLSFDKSFAEIEANFHNNFVRNVKRAQKAGMSVVENAPIEHWRQLRLNGKFVSGTAIFENILSKINANVRVQIWTANKGVSSAGSGSSDGSSGSGEEILSAVIFIFWKNRVYYFTPVSSVEGKKQGAMSLLLYEFIKRNAQKELIFDFEGSSIESIARYYANMGAVMEKYPVFYSPGWIKKLL